MYRNRPVRIMPRNYPLPDYINQTVSQAAKSGADRYTPVKRGDVVGPIDTDDDANPPAGSDAEGGCKSIPCSQEGESDFMAQSTGDELPGGHSDSKPVEESSVASETSETSLSLVGTARYHPPLEGSWIPSWLFFGRPITRGCGSRHFADLTKWGY